MLSSCRLATLLVISIFCVALGCSEPAEPRSYYAPKVETEFLVQPKPPVRPNAPRMGSSTIPLAERRILGSIIPFEGRAYFLKAVDRIERLEPVASAFRSVVEAFDIDPKTEELAMKLPEGWSYKVRETDNEFVMADILAPSSTAEPIKFTVSVLGISDWENDLLRNVDRWRGQLELPPTSMDALKKELPAIVRASGKMPAYIFDATSRGVGSGSANQETVGQGAEVNAPGSAELPNATSSAPPMAPKPLSGGAPKILSYDKPESWALQGPKDFRLLSFNIGNDGSAGEVIVSWAKDLPIPNASMWYKQVLQTDDEPKTDALAAQAVSDAETIPSGEIEGKLYSVRAGDEPTSSTLLVAAIPTGDDGMCLFVKLKGDLRMTEQEKTNLLSFVKSLRWERE